MKTSLVRRPVQFVDTVLDVAVVIVVRTLMSSP